VVSVSPSGIGPPVEIWTVGRDGSNPTRLTTGAIDQSPGFAPDGTKIVFVRIVNTTRQLFAMNADGSDQMQLPTSGNAFFPAWSR
jgi:TolB protein